MARARLALGGRSLVPLVVTAALATACTDGQPVTAPPGRDAPIVTTTPAGLDAPTTIHEAAAPSYDVPESPTVGPGLEDGSWFGDPGGRPLRPGATYLFELSSPLPPEVGSGTPEPRPHVELTVPAQGWSLRYDVLVGGRWDDGVQLRVLELDRMLLGERPDTPCDALRMRSTRGLSPSEVVAAIVGGFAFDVVEPPADDDRFGRPAVHVVLRLASRPESARCLDFNLWTYRAMRYFSETVELWVLDVDGRVVVVDASHMPTTRERLVAQLDELLDSLRLTTP